MSDIQAQMLAELERLRAENAALKRAKEKPLTLKVGESGVISIYGLNKFPVSLYYPQWQRVFTMQAEIQAFADKNKAELEAKALAKLNAVKQA